MATTLEDHIMKCWNITDDLRVLRQHNASPERARESMDTMLAGLIELYDLKFETLFHEYEKHLKESYQQKTAQAVQPRFVTFDGPSHSGSVSSVSVSGSTTALRDATGDSLV